MFAFRMVLRDMLSGIITTESNPGTAYESHNTIFISLPQITPSQGTLQLSFRPNGEILLMNFRAYHHGVSPRTTPHTNCYSRKIFTTSTDIALTIFSRFSVKVPSVADCIILVNDVVRSLPTSQTGQASHLASTSKYTS